MKRTRLAGLISATAVLAAVGLVAPALGEPTPAPTPESSVVAQATTPILEYVAAHPEVGTAVDAETAAPDGGLMQRYSEAVVYWHPDTDAQAVFYGNIGSGYDASGGPAGFYGYPTGPKQGDTTTGEYQPFQNGAFYFSPGTSVQAVSGAIGDYYNAFGGHTGYFGFPTMSETASVNGGVYQDFERGSFYWSPDTGTQPVIGANRQYYKAFGAEAGYFGYPTTGEVASVKGGVYQDFQKGTFYWSMATGTHPVIGAIRQYYQGFGGEKGYFGYPMSGEIPTINGGVYQIFEKGSFYWSPATGVHPVIGANRQYYNAFGAEQGYFGYPVTGEVASVNGGVYQDFQKGTFYWSPGTGTHPVIGAIRQFYQSNGAERGRFGYPVSPEKCNNAGCYQDFQGGGIAYSVVTGTREIYKLDPRCTYGRVVCADKSTNKMYWVINGQIQATFDVRFGAPGWETTNGEMTIFRKEAMSWSTPFSSWMPWSQYFTASGMAIHYSSGFEAEGFPSWGSHGCINMNDYGQAQWLYNQTRLGDRIVVYYS